MRQKKRAAAVLLSAVMAFSAVSPAVPVWAASWQKNASGSYIGSDGSVLTAVSYTHLDVYTRQDQPCHDRSTGPGGLPLPSSCGLCACGGKADPLVETLQGQGLSLIHI